MHGKILHIICSYKWGVISLVKYNNLGCCNIFHGNISVKAWIPQNWFDLCTQILVATMAICYANTVVEARSPWKPLKHNQRKNTPFLTDCMLSILFLSDKKSHDHA